MTRLSVGRSTVAAALTALLAAQVPTARIAARQGPRTVAIGPSGDLQAALDGARPGDVIELEPGAVYRGPFVLRAKTGDEWVVVRTAGTSLPPAGQRVSPAHAKSMAVLEAPHGPVVEAEAGAHHVRLVGLEIRPVAGSNVVTVVELGGGRERSEAAMPHDIAIERCYIHGDPARGTRRGVALNGRAMRLADSHVSDFKDPAADSQAVAGWNGPGPFVIENNYLEAAGENLMFGGADPNVPNLVPSDITIARNHFVKPAAWKLEEGAPGPRWSVKNLLELKNARRVRIEGNILEQNWAAAQNGFGILFTVRNQDGAAPWSVVEDVTFVNNIVRSTASGINVLGRDDNHPSGTLSRVTIANNLFSGIGDPPWGHGDGSGRFLQLLEESRDVVVEHNTILQTGNLITLAGRSHAGFAYRNNVARHNAYGIIGESRGIGLDSIGTFLPGAVVAGNIFIGGDAGRYPGDNVFVSDAAAVGFENPAQGLFGLGEGSRYRGRGTDGRDPGVDMTALLAATAGVVQGNPEAVPEPCRQPRLKMPPCPEAP